MQKTNLYVALALMIVLLASCAKEGPTGPTGPAGPIYYGNISVHVSLYDKYGSKIFANLNKVSIYLNNTSIAVYPDTTGYYLFENEPTGTYSLSATDSRFATSDSNFAATILYNVNFVSGTLSQDIKLSAIPDSFITAFTASRTTLADSLFIRVTPDTRLRNCIVFVNNSAASNTAFLLSYRVAVPGDTGTVKLAIPQQDLLNTGLVSGATVYYAAYSYVVNDASLYEDPNTGIYVYNAVYPVADTASCLVP